MTKIALALALAPLAAHAAAAKSDPPALARTTAILPVTVQGALPGYTDLELAQLVKACATGPVTNSSANTRRGWQLRITLDSEYMPRPATRITASLVHQGQTIAVRWTRAESADAMPSRELCQTITDLTW
jgi:hypothetical protein